MSPLAPHPGGTTSTDTIVTITDAALAELLGVRAQEPDAERLGLRMEIISGPGEPFRYDLSFDMVTTAAFTDEVRTIRGEPGSLKVIVPAKDVEQLGGATLDHVEHQGLIIRNPNTPSAPVVEGLTSDDELSASIQTLLRDEINPALAAHGGFVTYVGHDGAGTAYLTMGGGCHGCSMSKATMLDGVQTMLVEALPEVTRVRDLTDHSTGENPYFT